MHAARLEFLLSSRVSQSSAVFQWVSCVTYAMIAALTSRMIFLPSGVLQTSRSGSFGHLWHCDCHHALWSP